MIEIAQPIPPGYVGSRIILHDDLEFDLDLTEPEVKPRKKPTKAQRDRMSKLTCAEKNGTWDEFVEMVNEQHGKFTVAAFLDKFTVKRASSYLQRAKGDKTRKPLARKLPGERDRSRYGRPLDWWVRV